MLRTLPPLGRQPPPREVPKRGFADGSVGVGNRGGVGGAEKLTLTLSRPKYGPHNARPPGTAPTSRDKTFVPPLTPASRHQSPPLTKPLVIMFTSNIL